MKDIPRFVRLLALVAALAPGLASAADYVVVVNPANKVGSVSRNELSRLFLGTATSWPGGEPCKPVDLPKSSPVRSAFSKEVLGRTMAALDQYWTQSIFSGRGVPPPERKSDREVLEFVRDHAGAVGYVSGGAGLEGVKRLTVNG
jgi:ABC-type phosphate transport system substrate-binding protein